MPTRSYTTKKFESQFTYSGSDLGANWTLMSTLFRVWAPTAQAVSVNLYESGDPDADDRIRAIPMLPDKNGTWVVQAEGNLDGVYYTYQVEVGGRTVEACDPYAHAVGVNGHRAMVIDLRSTDPQGWSSDTDPNAGIPITDAVIYELHIRDISAHTSAGIAHRGNYLGLIEAGTSTPSGIPTGIDHISDLGVTHVQIMPMYDFGSVDASRPDNGEYNWGYDPTNYNVPEGSYASDPFHGHVRVREVKEMIKGFHDRGISVVMDVVYNHVYDAKNFCFNKIVPGYFSRKGHRGGFTNDSGCGNDTATERSMVRKFIVDSVCYWADEYHIDGFRFDLAGLIDILTIREVMAAVRKVHPNVIFYGEGWDMCSAPIAKTLPMTTQKNSHLVPHFAFFNDHIRDALRGSVFDTGNSGFITGGKLDYWGLAFCYAGVPGGSIRPRQSINYISCHDNHTLFDRITAAVPEASFADRVKMNRLAAAFLFTARGVPFFQAGEEMLRSKPDGKGGFVSNSYRSGDEVNAIRWDTLDREEYRSLRDYYRGLIAFRRSHPRVRAGSADKVNPIETGTQTSVGYLTDDNMITLFNAGAKAMTFDLPEGTWEVYLDGDHAGNVPLRACSGRITVPAISPLLLIRKEETL